MKAVLQRLFSFLFSFLFPFFFFFLSACGIFENNTSVIIPKLTKQFDWQGHRGARGLAPENTVPAFLKALEFPMISTLELDVAISADTQIVVSHEPWMSAAICTASNGTPVNTVQEENLLLFKMPYRQIKQYDCGKRGNPRFPQQVPMAAYKPLLKEVVEAVNHFCAKNGLLRPKYNIEIKCEPDWDGIRTPPPAEFAALVLKEVASLGITDHTCIQSFDPRALREVNIIDPKMIIALLVENLDGFEANLKTLGFTPNIYSPHYKLVSSEMLKNAHEKGIKVIPWTVNETKTMLKLIKMGVDGIITDYPDRIPDLERELK